MEETPTVLGEPGTELEQGNSQISFTDKIVTANGIKIAYTDSGGKGEPLVFLAGLGGNAHSFDSIWPFFAPKYRVICMSRRGYGKSQQTQGKNGYDIGTRTEDLRAFLAAVGVKTPANIVGFSIAGGEMTHLAAKYPQLVRRLGYIDAVWDYTSPQFKKAVKAYENWYDHLSADIKAAFSPPAATKDDYSSMRKYVVDYDEKYFPGYYTINTAVETAIREYSQMVEFNPDGSIKLDKDGNPVFITPDTIGDQIFAGAQQYKTEWDKIQCPAAALERHYDDYLLSYYWLKDILSSGETLTLEGERTTTSLNEHRRHDHLIDRSSAGTLPSNITVSKKELLKAIKEEEQLLNDVSDGQIALFQKECPQAQSFVVPRSTHGIHYNLPIATVLMLEALLRVPVKC